tara:strand:+ start:3370 stop:7827 length:4458 start_codon:yes stop_codon:yes gene_type:complete
MSSLLTGFANRLTAGMNTSKTKKSELTFDQQRRLKEAGPRITAEADVKSAVISGKASMNVANTNLEGTRITAEGGIRQKEIELEGKKLTDKRERYKLGADSHWQTFAERRKNDIGRLGPKFISKPTEDQVTAWTRSTQSKGYEWLRSNNLLPNNASTKQIEKGYKVNDFGQYLGTKGYLLPNGGFATQDSISQKEDVLAQINEDVEVYTLMQDLLITDRTSKDYRNAERRLELLGFNPKDLEDFNRGGAAVKRQYQRIVNYIAPNMNKDLLSKYNAYISAPKNKNIQKLYVLDHNNRKDLLKNKNVPRQNPEEIAKSQQAFIPAKTTAVKPRPKTPYRTQMEAPRQFAVRGQDKIRFKEAENRSINGTKEDIERYNAVRERVVLLTSNPAKYNKYNGAVNFATSDSSFGKKIENEGKRTGQVGKHFIGFSEDHKIKDSSYLEKLKPKDIIKPTSLEIHEMTVTALAEAEGEIKNNIENIDHVIEVIRNRVYHPSFQKYNKKDVQPLKPDNNNKKTINSVIGEDEGDALGIGQAQERGQKEKNIARAIKDIESVGVKIEKGQFNPTTIVQAAKRSPKYEKLIENNPNLNDEDLSELIRKQQNDTVDKTINLKNPAEMIKIRDKRDQENGISRISLKFGSNNMIPTDKFIGKNGETKELPTMVDRNTALGYIASFRNNINKSTGTKTHKTTIKELSAPDIALAMLSRFESFLDQVNNSSRFTPEEKKDIVNSFQNSRYMDEIRSNVSKLYAFDNNPGMFIVFNGETTFPNLSKLSTENVSNGSRGASFKEIFQKEFRDKRQLISKPMVDPITGVADPNKLQFFLKAKSNNFLVVQGMTEATKEQIGSNGQFVLDLKVFPSVEGIPETVKDKLGDEFGSNKVINMFHPDSKFIHDDPSKEAFVNEAIAPIKEALRRYDGTPESATNLVNIVSKNAGKIKSLSNIIGFDGSYVDGQKIIQIATSLAGERELQNNTSITRQKNVGGVNVNVSSSRSTGLTKKQMDSDPHMKDAEKSLSSARVVLDYLFGLEKAQQDSGLYSKGIDKLMPPSMVEGARKIIEEFKENSGNLNAALEESNFSPDEVRLFKQIISEQGALQTNQIQTIFDKLIQGGKSFINFAEQFYDNETKSLNKVYERSISIDQGSGLNATSRDFLKNVKGIREKVFEEYKKATQLDDSSSDNRNRKRRAIANAQRNFYATALTYHFAGLVQGGSGGRAISNEDFENLYRALWGAGGELQASNVKRAINIARTSINRAKAVFAIGALAPGASVRALNFLDPIIRAVRRKEEAIHVNRNIRDNYKVVTPENMTSLKSIQLQYSGENVIDGRPTDNAFNAHMSVKNNTINLLKGLNNSDAIKNGLKQGLKNIKSTLNLGQDGNDFSKITAGEFFKAIDNSFVNEQFLERGDFPDFKKISSVIEYSIFQELSKQENKKLIRYTGEVTKNSNAHGMSLSDMYIRATNPKIILDARKEYLEILERYYTPIIREFLN